MVSLHRRAEGWRAAHLSRQIIVPTVLVTLFFLGALGMAAFLLGEQAIQHEVEARNRQLAVQVSGEVEASFQNLVNALRLQGEQVVDNYHPEQGMLAFQALLQRYSPAFETLQLLNEAGEQVAYLSRSSENVNSNGAHHSFDAPLEESALEALQTRQITVSSVDFHHFDASPFITVAVPLTNGEKKGMLVAEIDLRILWTKVDSIQIDQGNALMVDQNGVIIAHPERQRITEALELEIEALAPMLAGYSGVATYQRDGEPYLAGYAPIRGTLQWGVIVEQKRAKALAPVRVIAQLAAFLTLISALSVALLLSHIVKRAVQPVEALSKTVGRIAYSGDLSHPLPRHARMDEIGTLTDSFNHMIKSLRNAQERLQRWNERLERHVNERTAQLKATNKELQWEIIQREEAEAQIKRINRDLIVARDQALEASRAKSAFLANMSHELRTPMNAILGYAQLFKQDNNLSEEQHNQLKIIQQSGNHLLTLINDILDISKAEAGKMTLCPEPMLLATFFHSVVGIGSMMAQQKDLAFFYQADPFLPVAIVADEKRLRQVLINLLSNAVKFTDAGEVHLRVSRLRGNANQQHSAIIRFEVQDSGIGMSAEQQAKIFLPFEQVGESHRQAEGTGLGLAISQTLVQRMGSELNVKSERGQGSTFCFDVAFPISTLAMDAPQPITDGQEKKKEKEEKEEIIPPSPQELEALHQLAKLGNMRAIRQHAAQLAQQNPQYAAFAKQLQQMARRYQERKILILIEQMREAVVTK